MHRSQPTAGSDIDGSPGRPLPGVRRIKENILQDIEAGRYGPGDAVPTGVELASRFGVSSSTANAALRHLKDQGVLHGGRGRTRSRVAIPGQNPPPTTAERVEQLTATLRMQIKDGAYPSGEMLPSDKSLAATYAVPHHVVVQAIKTLAAENLVETLASIGKIVRDPSAEPDERQLLSTSDELTLALRRDILNDNLHSGDPLPSSLNLAQRYGVSQTTVSKTLVKLQSQGFIRELPTAARMPSRGRALWIVPDAWHQAPPTTATDQECRA